MFHELSARTCGRKPLLCICSICTLLFYSIILFSQVASLQVDVPVSYGIHSSILRSDDFVKIMLQHIYPLFLFWFWYSSCFDVKCWFHTFPNRCSHISMGVLILLDHQDCHVKFFSSGMLLFKLTWFFQYVQDQFLVFLNGVYFIHPKLSLFSPPSHPISSWSQSL